MSVKESKLRIFLFALLFALFASLPALAGSAVIGSVAGSMNATVGGQSLLPNTTIFSGDSLQVRDGVAVIAVGTASRVVFGRDTVASFLKEANEVTVLLSQGNVSVFHPNDGTAVRVKAGELSITPAAGFKTLGEVAMANGSTIITAKEGALRVDDHGVAKNVAKGQTIVISPKTANHGKGSGAPSWGGGGNLGLEVATLGAGVTGAILAGVAIKRADDATNAADAATTAANQANTTAQGAATSAAAAAASAADADLLAQCTYDLAMTGTLDSPIVPSKPCPTSLNP